MVRSLPDAAEYEHASAKNRQASSTRTTEIRFRSMIHAHHKDSRNSREYAPITARMHNSAGIYNRYSYACREYGKEAGSTEGVLLAYGEMQASMPAYGRSFILLASIRQLRSKDIKSQGTSRSADNAWSFYRLNFIRSINAAWHDAYDGVGTYLCSVDSPSEFWPNRDCTAPPAGSKAL